MLQQRISQVLPTEIVQEIVMATKDLKDAYSFALTCKRMHQVVMPILNTMALDEVETRYPWCLPITINEKRQWEALIALHECDTAEEREKEEVHQVREMGRMYNRSALHDLEYQGKVLQGSTGPRAVFPWRYYRLYCAENVTPSMDKRREVLGNVGVIYDDMQKRGFLVF